VIPSLELPLLVAELPTLKQICSCLTFWGLLSGVVGLWLLLPARFRFARPLGGLLVAAAGVLIALDLPLLGNETEQFIRTEQIVFWLLALIAVTAAVAMITSRAPVYSAIWFAVSLLGVAGLLFQGGAQFLGVATVVVYAGAIVVTFLFVIMLAQPEGHSSYDRLTWGGLPKILSVLTAGLLLGILVMQLSGLKREANKQIEPEAAQLAAERLSAENGILSTKHMANLGRHLFSEQLIAVELAGTLLLVALVGAVAIAMQRQPRLARAIEEVLR
jgi:NADH-quinone oxidoreductase subunit J